LKESRAENVDLRDGMSITSVVLVADIGKDKNGIKQIQKKHVNEFENGSNQIQKSVMLTIENGIKKMQKHIVSANENIIRRI